MRLESKELTIGSTMPGFILKDPYGIVHNYERIKGRIGTVIVFTCNHCPYAEAIWRRLSTLYANFLDQGIQFIGINPNIHPDYPEDNVGHMQDKIDEFDVSFHYLVDDTQSTAMAYDAQCTPDIYVLDQHDCLFYHGALDDNWKDSHNVKTCYLHDALSSLVANIPYNGPFSPSVGCSIKWL